jgi:hypothetical protein
LPRNSLFPGSLKHVYNPLRQNTCVTPTFGPNVTVFSQMKRQSKKSTENWVCGRSEGVSDPVKAAKINILIRIHVVRQSSGGGGHLPLYHLRVTSRILRTWPKELQSLFVETCSALCCLKEGFAPVILKEPFLATSSIPP